MVCLLFQTAVATNIKRLRPLKRDEADMLRGTTQIFALQLKEQTLSPFVTVGAVLAYRIACSAKPLGRELHTLFGTGCFQPHQTSLASLSVERINGYFSSSLRLG